MQIFKQTDTRNLWRPQNNKTEEYFDIYQNWRQYEELYIRTAKSNGQRMQLCVTVITESKIFLAVSKLYKLTYIIHTNNEYTNSKCTQVY